MLNAELIQKLGQRNVSKDKLVTQKRMHELLKSASRKDKNKIDELTALKRVSINRVYKTGTVSAKITLAVALVLNVNPFYITGESNTKGTCSDKNVREFLLEKGYGEFVGAEPKPTRKARAKAAEVVEAPVEVAEVVEAPVEVAEPAPVPEVAPVEEACCQAAPVEADKPCVCEMDRDEALQLLKALFVQAKYSAVAQKRLQSVKDVLAQG